MNLAVLLWMAAFALCAVLCYALSRWGTRLVIAIELERARESFRLQWPRLEEMVLHQAQASGKPRGLKWRRCHFQGEPLWLLEGERHRVAALVPLLIEFEVDTTGEPAEGHASMQPRAGVVLLLFRRGNWHCAGRILFNLTPEQAARQLDPPWQLAPPWSLAHSTSGAAS